MNNEPEERVYQVTHNKDRVETVYLVSAYSERDAKTRVLDLLYDRTYALLWTAAQKAADVFGLMTSTSTYTNAYLCKTHKCSVSAKLYQPDVYRLYAIDTRTGVMS